VFFGSARTVIASPWANATELVLSAQVFWLGLTLHVTAVATPANAATPCGTYPAGRPYVVTRVPVSSTVNKGTLVYTRGNLFRNNVRCVGFPLGFYVKAASLPDYTLKASGTTDSTGSVRIQYRAGSTFRFVYHLTLSPSYGVSSAISEIIAR